MTIDEFDKYMEHIEAVCEKCILPQPEDTEDDRYSKYCKNCPITKSTDYYCLQMSRRKCK